MPRRLEFRDLSEFRRFYWQQWPTARIARHLRVDPSVVRRLIREHGLAPHDYWSANRFLAQERPEALRRAQTRAATEARRRRPSLTCR